MQVVNSYIKDIFRKLWSEKRCLVCASPFVKNDELLLCPSCRVQVQEYKGAACPLCGEIHANAEGENTLCARCIASAVPWQDFRFYAEHDLLVRALILQAKHHHNTSCANLLGHLILPKCREFQALDLIIPMPIHTKRLYRRGYNQCQEIARPISKALDIPIQNELLIRTKHRPPQSLLSASRRLTNLRNVFLANPDCQGKNILLIDDTMTTGTSLREACKALNKYNPKSISVCVVARTRLIKAN